MPNSADIGTKHQNPQSLKLLVERALESLDRVSSEVVRQIESRLPGHRFGLGKMQHMQEMSGRAQAIGESYDLTSDEIFVLKLALRAHDVGRHQQVLTDPQLTSPDRHGELGVEFLKFHHILDDFSEEVRDRIFAAVRFHPLKELPQGLSPESLKLCTIVQDVDRVGNVMNTHFLSPRGMREQIEMWYLNQSKFWLLEDPDRAHPNFREMLEDCIRVSLGKVQGASPDPRISQDDLYGRILHGVNHILSDTVADDLLETCTRGELLPDRCLDSYATYMLFQCATVFGIKNHKLAAVAMKSSGFQERLDFVQARISTEAFERIRAAFERLKQAA